jgi:polysaccharide pyruvyl transferase WcaK-like protein
MKICVQGAAFDTGNMGVGALAVGTVRCILHCYPQANVFFLNYEKFSTVYTIKFPDRQAAVPLVNMRFSWRFWLRNNIAFLLFLNVVMKLLPFPALRRRWIAGNDCLRHLDESDLVVAISGGDSFSDIYGLERLLYVSLPQILALCAGKRLILLPQTLGPFKGHFARAIAKYIMKRADVIYSRDHAGIKLVENWRGLDARAGRPKFCYDVGFVVDPIPPARIELVGLPLEQLEDKRLVGLNVSGLLYTGGYSRKKMFGLKTDYRTFIDTLIGFLIEKKKAAVILIPHELGSGGECDSPACEKVYEEFKTRYKDRLGVVRGRYNQSEIKYIIGLCDFFIGARMHACIAALSQGIPAVAVAYSDKFIGVLQAVGVGGLVADPRTMGEEQILNAIGEAFDRRAALRQQLEETIPGVKQAVLDLFKDIADPASKPQGPPGAGR